MKTLKQIYDEDRDIRASEIPLDWRPSFDNFIFGSTCLADTDENGAVKDFVYYASDFRRWYRMNREAIERDIKIDEAMNGNA